jgi:alpha-mannosidase
VVNYRKFTHCRMTWNVDVTARVKIPAFGYTALKLETASEPTRQGGKGLTTGPVSAENDFLTIEFENNGLLKLTDKRSGQVYDKLLILQDSADIGDGWYHGPAVSDELHYSGAANASIACIVDGPEKTTFRVELHWPLPAKFDFNDMNRDTARKELRVDHEVTLRAGCDRVEVKTTVYNQIKDHRLRILFPSGAKADTYLADSPFDVIQRPIALHKDHYKWAELEVDTKPQQSWTAVADKKRGLAVISDGLPESAVCDWSERPIALTLLRGFKKTVMTKGEPGGQIQGRHDFNYWIMPLSGGPNFTELCTAGQKLAAAISTVQPELVKKTNNPEEPIKPTNFGRGPVLPEKFGFIKVNGPVVVTAFRAGDDDSTVIRFFNPDNKNAKCEISLFEKIGKAWLCDLEEKAVEKMPVSGGKLKMNVDPKKIVTIKLIKG